MRSPPSPTASGSIPLADLTVGFVYHLYDRRDDTLYIGVTQDLCQRLESHRRASSWWHQVARITWERYESRPIAEHAETYLIRELLPRYNVRDNERRVRAAAMGHCRLYDGDAWRRLGLAVRAERESTRRTQKSMAADAGIKVEAWRAFEHAEFTEWAREVLDRAEAVLSWHPGSIEAVLAGGEPNRLTEEERAERALSQSKLHLLGDRI